MRTSPSGSSKTSTMSAMQAAPRSPIAARALTAAKRTLGSVSNMERAMSEAYIWPRTPMFSSAHITDARTWPQRSLKHLRSFSMCRNTPSPIVPKAMAALLRMPGCWLRSIFTTASTVKRLEPPWSFAIWPNAMSAAEATRTSLSAMSSTTSLSCFTPSPAILQSDSTAESRTSAFLSESSAASFPACFQPSGPSFAKASAAAHLGIRSAAGGLGTVQAAAKRTAPWSSKPSSAIAAISAAWAAAASPMAPSTVAAAALAPPVPPARSFATSCVNAPASAPMAAKAATAAPRTTASSSQRHWQNSAPYLAPAVPICAKYITAFVLRSLSVEERCFATAEAWGLAASPRQPSAEHAALCTSGSWSFRQSTISVRKELAFSNPRDRTASARTASASCLVKGTKACAWCTAGSPISPKDLQAATMTLTSFACSKRVTRSANLLPSLPNFPSVIRASACTTLEESLSCLATSSATSKYTAPGSPRLPSCWSACSLMRSSACESSCRTSSRLTPLYSSAMANAGYQALPAAAGDPQHNGGAQGTG
mmetsp:Transcript_30339/g.97001  ORF Transcript_30339/g.97001 Transcript_30339/m.97001 type:complete len:540 (-) Transcript_30339:27-1646(-)